MRKAIYLLLMGCIPLAFGALVNILVTSVQMPVFIISIIALFVWYFMGHKFGRNIYDFVMLNTPAAFFFVLIAFQELVLGQYIAGFFGTASQMFFLPFISAGALVMGWSGSMFGIYLGSFLLMLCCSYIGARQCMKGK